MKTPPAIHNFFAENPDKVSFHQAIIDRDFAKINEHLTQNKDLFYTPNQNGILPIFSAIENDDAELVESLLIHDQYLTTHDEKNNSLAHIALAKQKNEVFKTLIKINPDFLNFANSDKDFPIFTILKKNDTKLFDFITDKYPKTLFFKDLEGYSLSYIAYKEDKPEFFAKILKKIAPAPLQIHFNLLISAGNSKN